MLGCSECVIYQVANCPGFLSRGLSMMHKQMSGVLTWQQIAAAIMLCSHYIRRWFLSVYVVKFKMSDISQPLDIVKHTVN
ncbi:hypothetical protein ACSQ67_018759 [Phaseolus vulgaris]